MSPSSVWFVVTNKPQHFHLYATRARHVGQSGRSATVVIDVLGWSNFMSVRRVAKSAFQDVPYVVVPNVRPLGNRLLLVLIVLATFRHRFLAVHFLNVATHWTRWLRRWPRVRNRIAIVAEDEGDAFVESQLQRSVDDPKALSEEEAAATMQRRLEHFGRADVVVLASDEHAQLWRRRGLVDTRIVRWPMAFVDPSFDVGERERADRRRLLGVGRDPVVVYAGSIQRWQRFEDMCALVGAMAQGRPNLRFLFLSTAARSPEATEVLRSTGIHDRTVAIDAPPRCIASYLSAADAALFVRHRHTMNQIVVPAKLSEYILSGLPIVTNGVYPARVDAFLARRGAFVRVPDDLAVDRATHEALALLLRESRPEERRRLSSLGRRFIEDEVRPTGAYLAAIEEARVARSAPSGPAVQVGERDGDAR